MSATMRRRARIVLPLLALAGGLLWVALRAGPMAPVVVNAVAAGPRAIAPALSGSGEIDVREHQRIGSRVGGRLLAVYVDVGQMVVAGQVLAELDPVELNARLEAQQSALQRSAQQVTLVRAQLRQAQARAQFAETHQRRYSAMLERGLVSREAAEESQQSALVSAAEVGVAEAAVGQAVAERQRTRSDLSALQAQRADLRMAAHAAGMVLARYVDPGSQVQPGQTLLDIADPMQRVVLARFDQRAAAELVVGDVVEVRLRSHAEPVRGEVERVEPLADSVTEERRARVSLPAGLDVSVGERAELWVETAARAVPVAVPASALVVDAGRAGVWTVEAGRGRFVEVSSGLRSADGWIEIRTGLAAGAMVVSHRPRPLQEGQRLTVVAGPLQ